MEIESVAVLQTKEKAYWMVTIDLYNWDGFLDYCNTSSWAYEVFEPDEHTFL